MRVPLRSGPPKAENCPEVVFEELRSCHVRTAFPQVDLGPILEARRLSGEWSFEAGRLPSELALDLRFLAGC
jgi:hypothetical protein